MNKMSESELADLSTAFRRGLQNNYELFERHAFRKHNPGQDARNIFNASLWDVMTTGLAEYSEDCVKDNADDLREAFYELLSDDEFVAAITYSPNSVKRVERRFELANAMFEEVLDD
jgi:hypothetical protein